MVIGHAECEKIRGSNDQKWGHGASHPNCLVISKFLDIFQPSVIRPIRGESVLPKCRCILKLDKLNSNYRPFSRNTCNKIRSNHTTLVLLRFSNLSPE